MSQFLTVLALCLGFGLQILGGCRASARVRETGNPRRVAILNDTAQAAVVGVLNVVLIEYSRVTPVKCLELRDGAPGYEVLDPPDDLLRALAGRHSLVRGSDCPPTYASMITELDARGRPIDRRPRGYIDPYRVRVVGPEPDSLAHGILRLEVWQGTGGILYRCVRERDSSTLWRCREDGRIVS